ncbi:hypothetical protein GOB94_14275 [Granulicella sp. 5B5]|uniref:hypothetical protein n=1 Tax=Granulicella sp. 5B5 TaxID=1617967 RepID=UPI0015F72BB5|nr:hypothetical protein [Granulicella sp. 5B5]QMV19728.1 hypothetical protein GOB94_14275 [Granulicella sp. 5B5]
MNFFRKQIMMAGWIVVCLATLGAALSRPAQGQASQTDNPDWPLRSFTIHWPDGYTPQDADLFAHNEVVIQAPCSVVWNHLVKASSWPEWYANSHNVRLLNSPDGKLHPDTRFSWDTFGVHVESRVHEFVRTSRIGWFGDGTATQAYHTFLLEKVPAGCHVITEEVVKGAGAIEVRRRDPQAMHRGHDLWLASLKRISEK